MADELHQRGQERVKGCRLLLLGFLLRFIRTVRLMVATVCCQPAQIQTGRLVALTFEERRDGSHPADVQLSVFRQSGRSILWSAREKSKQLTAGTTLSWSILSAERRAMLSGELVDTASFSLCPCLS